MTDRGTIGGATPFLEVEDLSVVFRMEDREIAAVRDVSFYVDRGETVALVGESGSGKSVTALSVLQLLPYPKAQHPTGSIRVDGEEVVGAAEPVLRGIRGNRISMIFQEPMTSLNPLQTIERQIKEILFVHRGMEARAARERTLELLHLVGLRDAERRLDAYPHQLSGGAAPARHDRHGLGQRAGVADRRRADHGPRRDRAGAGPGSAPPSPGPSRHGDPADHPRPRHRGAHGRPACASCRTASW